MYEDEHNLSWRHGCILKSLCPARLTEQAPNIVKEKVRPNKKPGSFVVTGCGTVDVNA